MSHRVVEYWLGERTETLEDIVGPNPSVVFVGLNPSPVSVKKGHYHQGRLGKRFWQILRERQILSSCEGSEDDQLIPRFGITDIVKRPTENLRELKEEDFAEGRDKLHAKLVRWKPKLVCFIYKKAAEKFLNTSLTGMSGLLENRIGESKVFVMPPPYSRKAERTRIVDQLRDVISTLSSKG